MALPLVEGFSIPGCVQHRILVAGDSNVHRLQSVITEDDVYMSCLPVSGARFTHDRKQFREMLRTSLMTKTFCTRMYLHLGSNDALNCSDQDFYKGVTEVLNLVHETSPGMEIVVCEILPRGQDMRWSNTVVSEQRLYSLQRWISSSNIILKEICDKTQYARFLQYGTFMASSHLCADGLHLNRDGAGWCYNIITEDNILHQCKQERSVTEIGDEQEWPTLADSHCKEQTSSKTPFADVVRNSMSPVEKKIDIRDVKEKVTRKTKTKQLMHRQLRRRCHVVGKPSFEKARSRWIKKKIPWQCCVKAENEIRLRSLQNPVEYGVVNVSDHVAVEIPACQLSGPCLIKKPASSKPHRIHTAQTPHTLEKEHVQVWMKCPEKECNKTCSKDDFLMEHVIKRHVMKQLSENATPVCQDQQTVIQQENVEQEDNKEQPETNLEEESNTSRLKTFLSNNDVKINPGLVFRCGWEDCHVSFETYQQCESHAVDHATGDNTCRWIGCHGQLSDNITQRKQHITRHVYDNEEWFQTLQDLGVEKVGEDLPVDTNLFTFPKHLRSKLKLLLFDKDFEVDDIFYSKGRHGEYLLREYLLNPSRFRELKNKFLSKHIQLGDDWSSYYGPKLDNEMVRQIPSNNASSFVSKIKDCDPSSRKYNFVETTRPELSSNYYSGTKLINSLRKRKHEEDLHETEENSQSWLQVITNNLKICNQAIEYQQYVLDKISNIVDANNQKFFKIEQEIAKLSLCTAGTFVCFVFKCNIQEKEFYYIRYVESGCFDGYMTNQHLEAIRAIYHFSDENCLLHNVITNDDINEMKQVKTEKTVKRVRPDKLLKRSFEEVLPKPVSEVKKVAESCDVEGLQLNSYVITVWPFSKKVSIDSPEKPFLEVSSPFCPHRFRDTLVEFRTNKPEKTVVNSRQIFEKKITHQLTLFKQSLFLNCLSDDTKRNPEMYKRPGKFDANFLKNSWQASSLRGYILSSYLTKDFHNLSSFLIRYFPDLAGNEYSRIETQRNIDLRAFKKTRNVEIAKTAHVNKNTLQDKLRSKVSDNLKISTNGPITLFDTFCFNLIQHGKLSIQVYDGLDLVCCMNNYSEIDGSFKECDFVYTKKLTQETGDHFLCTCRTYSTLLEIDNSSSSDITVLDAVNENCVTCMHCKFLKLKVIPCLESQSLENESDVNSFVRNALKDKGKELVELCRKTETRKFSISIEDENPSLVHLTFNRGIGKHIVTCMNGECLSKKGHKKVIENFKNANACKHLSVLQKLEEFWNDLEINEDSTSSVFSNAPECNIIPIDIDELPLNAEHIPVDLPVCNSETNNSFDDETGLWHFKCKSTHKPNSKGSATLRLNVQKRDMWNDANLKRGEDGCLIGPSLFPDIPDNTCGCGSGWLKREDDDNYNENGIVVNDNHRVLTIYTSSSPVKCKILTRLCYNQNNQCRIAWDEGGLDAIHVLSRETGAGDEIGWEFVSLVMNSGCTFSSYCKLKTDLYQIRDSRSKFMDATVFINWWFSWAANMKIDFRQPCEMCGFEPKRLCCDGTRVGVGFRHAKFEEIEKVNSEAEVNQTLHRRMDRCFLKNKKEIPVSQMIKNREMLLYLAKETLQELKSHEILEPDTRETGVNLLMEALAEDFMPSFLEFTKMPSRMHENEKIAYAYLLKKLATTASMTSLLPPKYVPELQQLLNPTVPNVRFNQIMNQLRYSSPELRDFVAESVFSNNGFAEHLTSFLRFLINESLNMQTYESEPALPQPGTYNPARYGRAYYFNKYGLKLRNVRKFTMDIKTSKANDYDDEAMGFEKCQKLYSKVNISARGTTSLFLWFCADHGHCYGFHMTYAEGRKDPSASLYSYLEKPPTEVFYDFACNLQEYCLNRESGYYKDVRFFHDIFHGYSHKCSSSFRSSRLLGFESINSEICEQFNSFIQSIKKSARQMTQEHFCFYLQFFLNEWNSRKRDLYQKKIKVAIAGLY